MNIGSTESSHNERGEHGGSVRRGRHGNVSSGEVAVAARAEDQTSLTVRTAEGDVVSISIDAIVQAAAASKTSPSGEKTQAATASASTEIKVSVQGDLSDAELKDLAKLIQSLGEIDAGKASSLDGLKGLTSLAAFDYSHTRTVESGSLFQLAA